jgi:hypothetical protein
MTPKEKARELVDKFARIDGYQDSINLSKCEYEKQCALIAVEFAREEFRNHCAAEIDTEGSPDNHFDILKQEIEKL